MPYSHTFSCRLSDADSERFHASAELFDLKPSQYLRYLIRLPTDFHDTESNGPVVVLDRKALAGIRRELVRWGHHYNQAVHALNTLALATRKQAQLDTEYFAVTLEKISSKLDDVKAGSEDIAYQIAVLQSLPSVGDE